ncbi:MAG TPA: sugar phosphate isomerase/epimerase [Stellaceae bacterium]|jgi:sugar phosphate isomerase/epimerase|nr:sugar phosphate isomerase/epimerase [Stellaceae bacterium]
MNRLSLAPVTINELDPPALIAAAHEAGFAAVDLRVLGAPGAAPVTPVVGNRPMIAAVAAALADTGVTLFSATGIWLVPGFSLDDALPALEIAARLGAEYFLAVGNDPDEPRMTDNLARLAAAAASCRLRLALELMPYIAVNSLAKAQRLVAAAGAPNLGLLIDALHLARSGGTPAEVAAVPPERIAYLQLCDAPASLPSGMALRQESLTARLYPGQGGLPLMALMDALPAGIVVDVETPVAADRTLPAAERAARALSATQQFLTAWQARKSDINN